MTLDLVKIIAGVDSCGLDPTVVTGLRKAEMSDRSQSFRYELRISTRLDSQSLFGISTARFLALAYSSPKQFA